MIADPEVLRRLREKAEKDGAKKNLKFTCPECGSTRLQLVETRITVSTPILSVNTKGRVLHGEPKYDLTENEESWFECTHCSYRPKKDGADIRGVGELIEWLQNSRGNSPQSESEQQQQS